MSISIEAIKDAGNLNEERLVLKALKEEDIGYFVVFHTIFINPQNISTKIRHTYWFEDKKIKAGDYVVLYTKSGVDGEKKNQTGTTSHFFYWGLENTIWGEKEDAVALVELKTWHTKKASTS